MRLDDEGFTTSFPKASPVARIQYLLVTASIFMENTVSDVCHYRDVLIGTVPQLDIEMETISRTSSNLATVGDAEPLARTNYFPPLIIQAADDESPHSERGESSSSPFVFPLPPLPPTPSNGCEISLKGKAASNPDTVLTAVDKLHSNLKTPGESAPRTQSSTDEKASWSQMVAQKRLTSIEDSSTRSKGNCDTVGGIQYLEQEEITEQKIAELTLSGDWHHHQTEQAAAHRIRKPLDTHVHDCTRNAPLGSLAKYTIPADSCKNIFPQPQQPPEFTSPECYSSRTYQTAGLQKSLTTVSQTTTRTASSTSEACKLSRGRSYSLTMSSAPPFRLSPPEPKSEIRKRGSWHRRVSSNGPLQAHVERPESLPASRLSISTSPLLATSTLSSPLRAESIRTRNSYTPPSKESRLSFLGLASAHNNSSPSKSYHETLYVRRNSCRTLYRSRSNSLGALVTGFGGDSQNDWHDITMVGRSASDSRREMGNRNSIMSLTKLHGGVTPNLGDVSGMGFGFTPGFLSYGNAPRIVNESAPQNPLYNPQNYVGPGMERRRLDDFQYVTTLEASARPYTPDKFLIDAGFSTQSNNTSRNPSGKSARSLINRRGSKVRRSNSSSGSTYTASRRVSKRRNYMNRKSSSSDDEEIAKLPSTASSRTRSISKGVTGLFGGIWNRDSTLQDFDYGADVPHTATTSAGPARGIIREGSPVRPVEPMNMSRGEGITAGILAEKLTVLAREGMAKYNTMARETKQLFWRQKGKDQDEVMGDPRNSGENSVETNSLERDVLRSKSKKKRRKRSVTISSALSDTKTNNTSVSSLNTLRAASRNSFMHLSTVCSEGQRVVAKMWERGSSRDYNINMEKMNRPAGEKVKVYMKGARSVRKVGKGSKLGEWEKVGLAWIKRVKNGDSESSRDGALHGLHISGLDGAESVVNLVIEPTRRHSTGDIEPWVAVDKIIEGGDKPVEGRKQNKLIKRANTTTVRGNIYHGIQVAGEGKD
ncbi:hypothetical protein RUND412_004547 [Rhizina undulata]